MSPLNLSTNFTNQDLKIDYPQDSHWGTPDKQPAVIITDWESAEWESPWWQTAVQAIVGGRLKIYIYSFISLETTPEAFHFPETVQVFTNPTPNIHSNINLR